MFSSTSMLAQSGVVLGCNRNSERIQNCQNEDEALDVTYSCAAIKDKLSVVFELKPIEPRKRYGSAPQAPRIPLRLAVVIDVSCSMEEPYGPDDQMSKLEKVKLFAQLLASTMDEEDYLGIVTFGTKANVVLPLMKMAPEAKEEAMLVIEDIEVGGVTNLGAGLTAAIDCFKSIYSKKFSVLCQSAPSSRYFNDNIVLFTDGMANEGLVETDEMVRELKKHITALREESHFEKDYQVKLATLGTGGFLPELLFDIGMTFSSDAFYFLEENTNLELNMMKPVLLRQTALVTSMRIELQTINGVKFVREHMTTEYEPYDPDHTYQTEPETKAKYYIHDIACDMSRHLVCYLKLPNKHKKQLKNKDVLTLKITYRDSNNSQRTCEKSIPYTDVPYKEPKSLEKDIIINSQHETRLLAQKALMHSAEYMKKLDRARCRETLTEGVTEIQEYCEHISTLISEEVHEFLVHWTEPMIANLEYSEKFISDMSVRWDDAWARLMAMASSLGREVPTAAGVFMEGAEMYTPLRVDEQMEGLCGRLRDMYVAKGLCTQTIDQYRTVMRELQDKLTKLEEEGAEFKESRL